MAVHLKDKDIETIVEILDGWPNEKKLTWNKLLDAAQMRLGRRYTRQAFARYERIQRAYQIKKKNLRYGSEIPVVKPVELRKALERIERLKSENERLKSENNSLLEQFARWAYNAHTRGLDEDFLNKPLPSIDRDRTEL